MQINSIFFISVLENLNIFSALSICPHVSCSKLAFGASPFCGTTDPITSRFAMAGKEIPHTLQFEIILVMAQVNEIFSFVNCPHNHLKSNALFLVYLQYVALYNKGLWNEFYKLRLHHGLNHLK